MGQPANFVRVVRRVLLALSLLLTGATTYAAQALPAGSKLYAQNDGPVMIQFIGGGSAIFNNELYVGSTASPMLFSLDSSTPFEQKNLGSFARGAEVLFLNLVTDTGNVFSTGPASRNPDSLVHADIGQLAPSELALFELQESLPANTLLRDGTNFVTLVGFEDTFNLTNTDFNDMVFLVTNVGLAQPVPEPELFVLMCIGLGIVGWSVRRRS